MLQCIVCCDGGRHYLVRLSESGRSGQRDQPGRREQIDRAVKRRVGRTYAICPADRHSSTLRRSSRVRAMTSLCVGLVIAT